MIGMTANDMHASFRVALLATGGTLEKVYDPQSGELVLDASVIERLVETLTQPDVSVQIERLMTLDSLDMQADDRGRIVDAVRERAMDTNVDAVVVTHGTDTLAKTAAALIDAPGTIRVPVVLTGAMVPWCMADSDASQNVAQALMACRLLTPGVFTVFHGRVIAGGDVVKDYERLTLTTRGS